MTEHLRITVAVPSYNSARTIVRNVRSVLNQSWRQCELVVVDDASQDETLELVKAVRDERLRIIQNAKNLGAVPNWNRCIEEGTGEVLLVLHADDWLLPGALEGLARMMDLVPTAGAYGLNGIIIRDHSARTVGKASDSRLSFSAYPRGCEALIALITQPFLCSSVAVRRTVYAQIGKFDAESFPYSADEEMWARVARDWPIVVRHHPSVGVCYGGGGLMHSTWKKCDFWHQFQNIRRLYCEYGKAYPASDLLHQELQTTVELNMLNVAHWIAAECMYAGEVALARRYLDYAGALPMGQVRPRREQALRLATRVRWKPLRERLIALAMSR